MAKIENVESGIKSFLQKQGRILDTIQGRNPKIELYYSIWKGVPDWLDYNVWMPDGRVVGSKMLTLNLPRLLTRKTADNYANEGTEIAIPVTEKDSTSNDRLQEILKKQEVLSKFNQFCEMFNGVGIGAMVVRPSSIDKTTYEDGTIEIKPNKDADVVVQFVGGRRIFPITIEDGEITECAFVSYKTNGCKMTIHYKDENGNYNVAEINGFNKNNSSSYTFDYANAEIMKTNSNVALFVIWHPSVADEDDADLSIGIPIYSTALDCFKQCDMNYTMLYKELKLGQKKMFIQPSIVDVDAHGTAKQLYNPDDESVIQLSQGEDGNNQIQEFSANLRTQQIIQALQFNMNMAAKLSGLGDNCFEGLDGASGRPIQTATGVIAKQTELYRNVIKQENFARDRFAKLVSAIQIVNNDFTNQTKIEFNDINDIVVKFDDNIMEDTASKKEAMLKEVSSGVRTIAEYRAEFVNESEEEAKQFVYDNAILTDKYLPALQLGAMTIEKYCELVYGEIDNEIVEAFKSKSQAPQIAFDYEDEADEQGNEVVEDAVSEITEERKD